MDSSSLSRAIIIVLIVLAIGGIAISARLSLSQDKFLPENVYSRWSIWRYLPGGSRGYSMPVRAEHQPGELPWTTEGCKQYCFATTDPMCGKKCVDAVIRAHPPGPPEPNPLQCHADDPWCAPV